MVCGLAWWSFKLKFAFLDFFSSSERCEEQLDVNADLLDLATFLTVKQ